MRPITQPKNHTGLVQYLSPLAQSAKSCSMGSVQASSAPSDDPIVDRCLAVIVEPDNALSLPLSDYLSLCLSPSLPLPLTHTTQHPPCQRDSQFTITGPGAHIHTHTHTRTRTHTQFTTGCWTYYCVHKLSAKLCSYIWLNHCLICTGKITYYGSLALHKITLKYIAF